MVERKGFLPNAKHQYRVSKNEKHYYSDYNKKNADYYEYPSLTHFIDKH